MRVSVIINGKAGRANQAAIRRACDRALFRLERTYFEPQSPEELQDTIVEAAISSDALIVCGGDGTLNNAVQPLLNRRRSDSNFVIPAILPMPVGTANDLASELGVSLRLENAARLILETEPKRIDVIEVKSESKSVYMLTNGGLGIAADVAKLANETRERLRIDSRFGNSAVRLVGSHIYEILLGSSILTGKSRTSDSWSVTIEIDGQPPRKTSSPFIMVNNQPGLGGSYVPAPLTSNTDGTFNILLVESSNILKQVGALWKIRGGLIPPEDICPRIETRRATFTAGAGSKDLTFFGDGEILQAGVRKLEVTCLKRALPVFIDDDVRSEKVSK